MLRAMLGQRLASHMIGALGSHKASGLLSVARVPRNLSGPDIQAVVLHEARLLLDESQANCRSRLTSNRERLAAPAQSLPELEVSSGDELECLLGAPVPVNGVGLQRRQESSDVSALPAARCPLPAARSSPNSLRAARERSEEQGVARHVLPAGAGTSELR